MRTALACAILALLAVTARAQSEETSVRLARDFAAAFRARDSAEQTILAARPASEVAYTLAVNRLLLSGDEEAARALAAARAAVGGPEAEGLDRLLAHFAAGQRPTPVQMRAWSEAEKLIADGKPALALARLDDAGEPLEGTVLGCDLLWTRARALAFDERKEEAAREFGACARLAGLIGWLARARDAQKTRLGLVAAASDEALDAATGLVDVARLLDDRALRMRALATRAEHRIPRGGHREACQDLLESAGLAKALGEPLMAAQALERVAQVWQTGEGQPRQALKFHEQALELLRGLDAAESPEAREALRVVLLNTAIVLTGIGRYDDALALLDELAERGLSFPPALLQRAYVLRRQQRLEKSLAAYDEVLAAVRSPVRTGVLLDLAELQLERTDLAAARERFHEFRAAFEFANDRALAGLALIEGVRGNEEESLALFGQATDAAADPASKARVLLQRAALERSWGRVDDAIRTASEALRLLVDAAQDETTAEREYGNAAVAYGFLGDLLLLSGREEQALDPLGKAAAFFFRMQDARRAIPAYARWMLVLLALDRREEALERLTVLRRLAQGTPDDGLRSVAACADGLFEAKEGRLESARALFAEARELAERAGDLSRQAAALAHEALVAPGEGVALAERALTLLDARRVEAPEAHPFVEGESAAYAASIALRALLAREDPSAEKAFALMERARLDRLQVALRGRGAILEATLPADDLRALAAARGRLVEARAEGSGIPEAEAAFDRMVALLRPRSPLAFPVVPAPAEVRGALREDEALLLMLDDRYVRATLVMTAQGAALRAHETQRPLDAVADLLDGKRRLIVVPDGVLALDGTPWKEGVALDAFEIYHVASASSFLRLRSRTMQEGRGAAALSAGPPRFGAPIDAPRGDRLALLHVGAPVRLDLTHPQASTFDLGAPAGADTVVFAATSMLRGPAPSADGALVVAAACLENGARHVVLPLLGEPPAGLLEQFYALVLEKGMSVPFALREARRRALAAGGPPGVAAVALFGVP